MPGLRIRARARRAIWLSISRCNTLAEAAPPAKMVCQMGAHSFRQVGAHGKVFGQRYTVHRPPLDWLNPFQVINQRGEISFMAPATRVRQVHPQEETLHSRFSRMLKAEFRRSP